MRTGQLKTPEFPHNNFFAPQYDHLSNTTPIRQPKRRPCPKQMRAPLACFLVPQLPVRMLRRSGWHSVSNCRFRAMRLLVYCFLQDRMMTMYWMSIMLGQARPSCLDQQRSQLSQVGVSRLLSPSQANDARFLATRIFRCVLTNFLRF